MNSRKMLGSACCFQGQLLNVYYGHTLIILTGRDNENMNFQVFEGNGTREASQDIKKRKNKRKIN